jgi:4-hydroxybenzoate polyprenyltransferase
MAGAFGLAAVVAASSVAPEGSLDGAYVAGSAVTLLASSALTVMSFRLAALRAGRMPVRRTAAGYGIKRATLMALGLVALIANVVAGLSGHFSLLTWILAALVGALILLIRYRDQHRQSPSDR